MFSSIAPLARLNPFYAPHFQLVQDGLRKRTEPAEAPSTRRSLAAASAAEGESGGEGRGRAAERVPVPVRAAERAQRPPGWGGAGAGPTRGRLEDEEGHGRGRRWQPAALRGRRVLGGTKGPALPAEDTGRSRVGAHAGAPMEPPWGWEAASFSSAGPAASGAEAVGPCFFLRRRGSTM